MTDTRSSHDQSEPSARPAVFLSYSFGGRDEWIKYCVPPLLDLYGCEALSGEEEHGERIEVAVTKDIARSQLLIAFLTKDQKLASGAWAPSEWVLQEIGFAHGKGIPVILIRDGEVYSNIGIMGNVKFIEFDAEREAFWLFPRLRSAINNLLFGGRPRDGFAVCHMPKRGRKDHWNRQWWDFWLWIDGDQSQLNSIAEVNYQFPPAFFPKSEAGDPLKAFGDYAETDLSVNLKAKILFKSGKRLTVPHRISLPHARFTRFGLKSAMAALPPAMVVSEHPAPAR